MKDRLYILFLSALLLMAVSYVQVFHKVSNQKNFLIGVSGEVNDDAEEGEKSTKENSRETDQDEDPFNLGEMPMIASANSLMERKNEYYSFDLLGYYPEIVSPPPQV